MSASLVGSEMCIRDRQRHGGAKPFGKLSKWVGGAPVLTNWWVWERGAGGCLLYTSDAADDM
eukprot:9529130-Alexandrium_andersonii.AAC.1